MRRKQRRWKLLKIKILLPLIFLCIIVLFFLGNNYLNISKVEIPSSPDCVGTTNISQIQKLRGQNFFRVDKKGVEDGIKKQYPCVQGIYVNKFFPDRLEVRFLKREGKIALINIGKDATSSAEILDIFPEDASSSSKLTLDALKQKDVFLADEEGVIFSDNPKIDLPKVFLSENLKYGDRIEADLIKGILEVNNKLKIFGLSAEGSLINSDGSYFINSHPRIYFNLKSNLDFQIASLQLILKEAKINRDVVFVDLRFDKPIVKYAPKKN